MRELNTMSNVFNLCMIVSLMLILLSVISVYIILCRLRYREKVIIQREKELDKDERWLERKLQDIEKREDRLNHRIKEYRFLTD